MDTSQGTIHWSELMTRDPAAAKAFFERVIGWQIEAFDMGEAHSYHVCMQGGRPIAGIFTMDGPDFTDMEPHWMTYIAVEDADKTCEQTVAAGGEVVRPCFDVETVGRIAMIKDPTGGVVGIIKPAAQATA
ncbi:MAG: VOC family protein [Pseudomonadota bacterium]